MIENPEIIKLREKPNKSKAHNRSMHQFEIAKKKKREKILTLLPFQASYTRFAMRESHKALYLLSYFTYFYTHAGAESKTWNLWLFISLSFEDSLSLSLSLSHTHTHKPQMKIHTDFLFWFWFWGLTHSHTIIKGFEEKERRW